MKFFLFILLTVFFIVNDLQAVTFAIEKDYEIFFQNASRFSKIKLLRIIKCNKDICILGLVLYPKFAPKNTSYINDKWIKVSGIWYHKYNDSLLPKF